MKKPLVSIIISNYNGKDKLRQCLRSLERLKYPYKEIIVVDCGSSDGTPEIVESEFPFSKLIKKGRIGIGKAINIGILESKGEIVVFDLNNDDEVYENWLDPLVKVLTTRLEVGVVCGKRYLANTKVIDEAGGIYRLGISYSRGHGKKDTPKYNYVQEVDVAGVIATRRAVINEVGLLDEEYYIMGEDFDFCLRVRKHGYKILYVPSSILYHHRSATIKEKSPAKLYYNARARILCIMKYYSCHKKIMLLAFHILILPLVVLIYYISSSPQRFFDFLKAQMQAIKDALQRRLTLYH